MAKKSDKFWRDIINGLNIEKDLIGDPEFVTEEPEKEEKPDFRLDPELSEKEAAVLRFKLDLYIISPSGSGRAYLVTGKSQMEDAGIMKVKDALKMIERRNKK